MVMYTAEWHDQGRINRLDICSTNRNKIISQVLDDVLVRIKDVTDELEGLITRAKFENREVSRKIFDILTLLKKTMMLEVTKTLHETGEFVLMPNITFSGNTEISVKIVELKVIE